MDILFLMLAAHAFADFALQNPWHSSAKYPGNATGIPWQIGLLYHSLIHGGLVALITGQWWIGFLETATHAMTDYGKGRGYISAQADQIIHIAYKVAWAVLVTLI